MKQIHPRSTPDSSNAQWWNDWQYNIQRAMFWSAVSPTFLSMTSELCLSCRKAKQHLTATWMLGFSFKGSLTRVSKVGCLFSLLRPSLMDKSEHSTPHPCITTRTQIPQNYYTLWQYPAHALLVTSPSYHPYLKLSCVLGTSKDCCGLTLIDS